MGIIASLVEFLVSHHRLFPDDDSLLPCGLNHKDVVEIKSYFDHFLAEPEIMRSQGLSQAMTNGRSGSPLHHDSGNFICWSLMLSMKTTSILFRSTESVKLPIGQMPNHTLAWPFVRKHSFIGLNIPNILKLASNLCSDGKILQLYTK